MECKNLWLNCINAWHNISGIDGKAIAKTCLPSTWLNLANLYNKLDEWKIDMEFLLERKLGARNETYFWKDKWLDGMALKDVFS